MDLYERRGRSLRAVAARYVGDDAEDVVQDAFMSALCSAGGFRGDAAPLTWVHRIVRNASIDYYRKRIRREDLDRRRPDGPISGRLSVERVFAIRTALRELTKDQYRVLVMYDLIGYTHTEIAERLNIPSGTSRSRLSEARRRLQEELSQRDLAVTPRRRARPSVVGHIGSPPVSAPHHRETTA
ncbi:MAG: RNA polymerase sigma factor [Vicinamibacterales bacterium]